MILSDKGSSRLSKGSNDIVSKIFKIHSHGTAGNGGFAEGVNRGLHENICKAKDSALQGRGQTDFQDF